MTIDVKATATNGTLALVVSDDGPGLQPARSAQPGIGLTNTTNRLARLYGDEAGSRRPMKARGVRVTITLPAANVAVRGCTMRLKVLVVDDEPLARDGLKLLLGRQPGIESVSEARNGREAIAVIRDRGPTSSCSTCRCRALTASPSFTPLGADRMPAVIFVTAHDQYAIRAFEISARRLPAEAGHRGALRARVQARDQPVAGRAGRGRHAPGRLRCSTRSRTRRAR